MHFAGSLRHVFVRNFLSFQWPILSPAKVLTFPPETLSRFSRLMKGSVHAREEIHPTPFAALFYDTNSDHSSFAFHRHLFMPLRDCSRSFLQRASSRSISLCNFYDGELGLGERLAHKDRESFFFPLTMCQPYSTLEKKSSLRDIWQLGITFAQ